MDNVNPDDKLKNIDLNEQRLKNIGLDATQIKNIMKGKQTLQNIIKILDIGDVQQSDKKVGNILYQLSTKLTGSLENRKKFLVDYVVQGKLTSTLQLDAAFEYLEKNVNKAEVNLAEFDSASGVGVNLSEEQIVKLVTDFVQSKKEELTQIRYQYVFTEYMKKVRAIIPFADGGIITKELKSQIDAILGPKTEEDDKKAEESRKKKVVPGKAAEGGGEDPDNEPRKKITDLVGRDVNALVNTEKQLEWRKQHFGDQILTRFPPEPNGYLHIGHAKSMRFNFILASSYGGNAYLRLDDTNPEKECQEYIDKIKENLQFLGYNPWKVTYASDNFETLYKLAVKLIKMGKAYACFMPKVQASELRKASKPSTYRDTSVEENLKIFQGMRLGLYKENEVCLRAKIDFANPNPTLRDPAIYRIRYTPHPHAGNKWCIYPLYDFTHCICDSIEGISHSCCTLEFEIRRDLYYWFLEQLDLYKPYVWEFSRLNVSHTVLSKRKLHKLVFDKIVDGWDDPRILTLNGLRRRGYTADSINDFCDLVSVTRRGNENINGMHLLEHCIRKDLDTKAPRTMAVLDPVLATIVNMDASEEITVNTFPKEIEKGSHKVILSKKVWVDRSDIRLEDHVDFRGIAPGKTIGLKYCGCFIVLGIEKDQEGIITEVKLERIADRTQSKGFLHWVSVEEAVKCEIRLYEYLFNVYDPNELEDYVQGINPDSKAIFKNALMHKDLLKSKKEDKYQFERLGYFTLDYDSDELKGNFVWNRTVTLKDSEKAKAMAKVEDKPQKQKDQKKEKKKQEKETK